MLPATDLIVVFKPVLKLSVLSKLKSRLSILECSNVVYKFDCNDCDEFYVGMTTRRLKQRAKEHSKSDSSALCIHSITARHAINYNEPSILERDNNRFRLMIKESFLIHALNAKRSLNKNVGSIDLQLWQ